MTTTASSDALSRQHTQFHGRLVFVGFGSIGQGVLPLILRHIGGLTPERMTIITAAFRKVISSLLLLACSIRSSARLPCARRDARARPPGRHDSP